MDSVTSNIRRHPAFAALALAVLVILVVVLAYFLRRYRKAANRKAGFEGGETAGMPGAPGAPAELVSPFPQVGPVQVCGRGWDPAASAEAQALASAGSLLHDSYGEGQLQGAIDGAFDSGAGLNDEQLETLMHQGALA